MQLFNELLKEDLHHIKTRIEFGLEELNQSTFFLTGGTGFFGKWMLESIAYINAVSHVRIKTIVLSRDPELFLRTYPYLQQPDISFTRGDVRNFIFPQEQISYIVHAGTAASDSFNKQQPAEMFDVIVSGTQRVLALAKERHVRSFLFTSSGAVYGIQPPSITHLSEEYSGGPQCSAQTSAYGEGKRAAEALCSAYYHQYAVPVKIARCFAFVGPYLPLDTHFAIGNFILNALQGQDIVVKGDGTPYRSYLYASDLMIWLLTILLKGKNNEPYNVGSNKDITIETLAHKVADAVRPKPSVRILQEKRLHVPAQRYVPNVDKAINSLSLEQTVDIDSAIKKTVRYEQTRNR